MDEKLIKSKNLSIIPIECTTIHLLAYIIEVCEIQENNALDVKKQYNFTKLSANLQCKILNF